MSTHTHQTAPTRYVEANSVRFAYRRFGKATGAPLVFNEHYTCTMDHWDPAATDGFAREREVIVFNNAGVSRWNRCGCWSCRRSPKVEARQVYLVQIDCRAERYR